MKKENELLQLALEPLAALVRSGECVDAPTGLCESVKKSVIKAHDEILEYLDRASLTSATAPEPLKRLSTVGICTKHSENSTVKEVVECNDCGLFVKDMPKRGWMGSRGQFDAGDE